MATQKHDDPIGGIPIAAGRKNQPPPASLPASPAQPPRPGRKAKDRKNASPFRTGRLILATAGVLLALALGIYLLVPYLLTRGIPQYMGSRLHRSITIGGVDFTLLPPTLTVRHGIIGPRNDIPTDHIDPLLSFSELSVSLDPKALLRGTIALRKLTVDHPFFHFVLRKDGSSNLAALLTELNGQQQPQPQSRLFSRLLQFGSAADISINDGRLLIDDEKTGKHHDIEKIVVRLPAGAVGARSKEERFLAARRPPEISAVINGKPVSLAGRRTDTPQGPALDLQLKVSNTNLKPYLPYIPAAYGYRVLAGRGDLLLDCLLPRQLKADNQMRFTATLKLTGLRLQNAASTEIAIGTLGLSAEYLSAKRQLAIKDLSMDAPSFTVTRQADGSWSFPGQKLLTDLGKNKSAAPRWQVEELSVRHGTARFTDLAVKGGFSESIDGITLSLHGLRPAVPQKPTSFSLQARSRQGSTVTMEGQLLFSPLSASGMLLVDNLPLPPLAPYFGEIPGAATLKNGALQKASASFSLSEDKDGKPAIALHKATLLVDDLNLTANGDTYMLPSVKINEADLDFGAKRLEIGQLQIPNLQATIIQNDLRDWSKALPPPAAKRKRADRSRWQTGIRQATLQKATVRAGSGPQPSRLFSFSKVDIANLDSTAERGGKVAGQLSSSAGGTLQFAGQLFLTPFRSELQIILDDLPLRAFPEFWDNWLNLPVQKGKLQAKGVLLLPDFSFSGSFGISNFWAGSQAAPVIAWHQLITNRCSLARQPFSLSMKTVTVDRPYLQWTILGPHRSNLNNLLKHEHENSSSSQHGVKIDDITVHDGSIDFADQALSPTYLTHCTRINGSIDTLTNNPDSRSHLSMNGMLPEEASFSLDGNFGFFAPQFYADFTSNVNDLDLRPLSPYTEPVLGYALSKGLLNMRTTFHQENGRITADNHLKLTNLKLGRQLQNLSQLPLTIALLTDPDGTIELSVPVRGESADPSFSFHNSFFATLRNLVLRTAVSPFSVLNALIPKSSALDLDHVSFDFGDAKLSAKAANQLTGIARAVKLRPWLCITIVGEADAKTDLQTLTVRQKQQRAVRQLQQERQLSRRLSSQYGNEVIELGDLKNAENKQKKRAALPPPGKKELVALARERAQAVYQTLKKLGVAERQLHLADRVLIVGADAESHNGNRASLALKSILPL